MSANLSGTEEYNATEIYDNLDYDNPKEIFKLIVSKLMEHVETGKEYRLLDVGGASGMFVKHVHDVCPAIKATCFDFDADLIEIGRRNVPQCAFEVGDANDLSRYADGSFDFVTLQGIVHIMDDFTVSLGEGLRVARPGGVVVVEGLFNNYPVDAIIRVRESGDAGPYVSGWNLFSKKSFATYLDAHPKVASHSFERFHMPFDLEPQADPMRTWTEMGPDGKRTFRNGLMPINYEVLTIELAS